jgi:hypothetical protein
MEVYSILGLLENIIVLSKNDYDKQLAIQQKFIYAFHKRDLIMRSIRHKLYLQAKDLINDNFEQDIHNNLVEYITYCENLGHNINEIIEG